MVEVTSIVTCSTSAGENMCIYSKRHFWWVALHVYRKRCQEMKSWKGGYGINLVIWGKGSPGSFFLKYGTFKIKMKLCFGKVSQSNC